MEHAYDISGTTGEVVVRQLTSGEQTVRNNLQSKIATLSAVQDAVATAKTSAKTKLAALGLTEAEIAALVGG